MRPISRHLVNTVFVIVTAVATGCGIGHSGTEGAGVDLAALQTGNYPTTPRTPEELRTPATVAIQVALRLGEHVPLILETSPKLVFNRVEHQRKYFTRLDPPKIVDNFSTLAPGFVAGWETTGQRRADELQGRSVDLVVLQFSTPKQATDAARALTDALWHSRYPPLGTLPIPGYPDAYGQTREYGAISAAAARDRFVLWTYIGGGVDIPPNRNELAVLAGKVFDTQFDHLRDYEPPAESETAELPVDRDGILEYALPPSDGAAEGVMSADTALHLLQRPDLTKRAFDDARVDLVVDSETQIYRAGDDAAAERLLAYFAAQLDPEEKPVDSPPGLPGAHCVENPETTGSLKCLFTVGRYTAIVAGTQIQDLHQKVAAQYTLLDLAP
ncbi:DUF7373 family lipoprotein [Nocardia sp. NPDC003963]